MALSGPPTKVQWVKLMAAEGFDLDDAAGVAGAGLEADSVDDEVLGLEDAADARAGGGEQRRAGLAEKAQGAGDIEVGDDDGAAGQGQRALFGLGDAEGGLEICRLVGAGVGGDAVIGGGVDGRRGAGGGDERGQSQPGGEPAEDEPA